MNALHYRILKCAALAAAIVALLSPGVRGQNTHSDVTFAYENGRIKAVTANASGVGVGVFATDGLFRQFETNPGFGSENDVGLGIDPGDIIAYNVLDSLFYWDGTDFGAPDAGTQIRIENNLGAPDTIVTGSSGSQPGSSAPAVNTIGEANGAGDFHSHSAYILEPNTTPAPAPPPEFGAYGLKLSLSTDAVGIADSDPFLVVFNFGLASQAFDQAIEAFAALLGPALAGDYNGNGIVDAADYPVWRDSLGRDGANLAADGNGDLVVSHADYLYWKERFKSTASVGSGNAGASVPESGAATLALVAGLGAVVFSGQRRRVSKHRISFLISFDQEPPM